MTYDGKLLSKAAGRLNAQKEARAALFEKRRAEAYEKLPRVEEIDKALAESVIEAIKSALSRGADPKKSVEKIAERNLALQKERAALLKGAFLQEDYLDEKPECCICKDTGYVGTKPCECLQKLYKDEQRKELSGLLRLGEETFDSFNLKWYANTPLKSGKVTEMEAMALVLDNCVSYAKEFGKGSGNLLFTGGTGTGKTFLSTCIAKVVSENGSSVVYDTAGDVFSKFESEKFSRGGNMEDIQSDVRRYLICDLLILDDLGTEMTTSFVVSALYYLVNTRLVSGKNTIISTNLTLSEIDSRYSPQIASRIAGEYTLLKFYGEDIRLQKRSARDGKLGSEGGRIGKTS